MGEARLCRRRPLPGDVPPLDQGPAKRSGASTASGSTGSSPTPSVKNTSFDPQNVSIKWFEDGVTNVAHNCIDRHLPKRADQTAIIWEGDDPAKLEAHHLRRAPRAGLPLRQCAQGAGRQEGRPRHDLSADDPRGGLRDARLRAHRRDPFGRVRRLLARRARRAHRGLRSRLSSSPPTRACAAAARCRSRPMSTRRVEKAGGVKHVLVVRHTGGDVAWNAGRDVWLHEAMEKASADCPPEPMNAEDPLFILYTSGSTGTPKGVLHTTGGYLVFASMTHQYVFDYHDGDIYWCTADVGWVTGHSYIVYGPLANGATTLMFEGVPNYPIDQPLLGGHRQAQGQHLLHRADRDPRADGRGRRAGEEDQPRVAAPARLGRRADQSRGLGMVSPRRRRRALPDRRHLVADRDRRHPDHAAARRDQAEARLGDAAVLRRQAGDRRRRGQGAGGRLRGQSRASPIPGPARCAPSMATTSAS